jgi:hypothetical protein
VVLDLAVEGHRGGTAMGFDVVFDLKFIPHFDVGIDLLLGAAQGNVALIDVALFGVEMVVVIVFDDGNGLVDADCLGLIVDLRIKGELFVDEPFGGLNKSGFECLFDIVRRQPFFMGNRVYDIQNFFHRYPSLVRSFHKKM